jgi:hypothetical protein
LSLPLSCAEVLPMLKARAAATAHNVIMRFNFIRIFLWLVVIDQSAAHEHAVAGFKPATQGVCQLGKGVFADELENPAAQSLRGWVRLRIICAALKCEDETDYTAPTSGGHSRRTPSRRRSF